MRMGRLGHNPMARPAPITLGYIERPVLDPLWPVPMPFDRHRAPKNALSVWPTQRGKR